jgi:sulfur relay (sulfurtransferase) complex TusBCD TusD component (DsrE family)
MRDSVIIFTRNGLGQAPQDLQQNLAKKFLRLTLNSEQLPGKILFYTDGVKLACGDSLVLDELKELEEKGVELVLCLTCLEYFGLLDQVRAGVVGGMGDILTAIQMAHKVISL